MSSKIKVDIIETVSGSGNVTVASGNALRVASGDLVVAGGNTSLTGNLSTSGTSTLTGDLTVDTNTLHVDSSNNRVGIGTTSPAEMLEVYNTTSPAIQLNDGGDYKGLIRLAGNDLEIRGSSGSLEFYNGAADGDSSTLVVTIDASGTTAISPAGSELARFSGTQFMVGKTVGNFTTAGSIQQKSGADGSPAYFYQVKTYSGTRNSYLNYHNGTYVGGINMTNTSTSFPTSSDERLKKNIKDAPSGGDKIDAMKVRSFNWKVDDSLQEYGLVAQELEKVYDWPVESLDNGDAYTIDYTKLVPIMLKEIQDLRKRVATLESS